MGFSRQYSEIDCHAFLQGIFLTQGSNSVSYVSCIGRWVLYHLCYLGSPGVVVTLSFWRYFLTLKYCQSTEWAIWGWVVTSRLDEGEIREETSTTRVSRGVRNLHMLILDRGRGWMEGLRGEMTHFSPSPSPAGQEADLEHSGWPPCHICLQHKIIVFWGLGRTQAEVLQKGGQAEEELWVGQALTQTEAFSWGFKGGSVSGQSSTGHLVAPPPKFWSICLLLHVRCFWSYSRPQY